MEEQTSPTRQNQQAAKGFKIATIVLAIVAVAGMGFGVFQLIMNQQQKRDYDSRIQANEQTIAELQNKQAQPEQKPVEMVDNSGCIYVGAWNLKIKVPENLKNVSYLYKTETDSVSIWGMSTGHGDEIPFFAKPLEYSSVLGTHNHSPLGYLARMSQADYDKTAPGMRGTLVRTDGDIVFTYSGPQAIQGENTTRDWEVESVDLIKSMLSNPENYSAI